MSDQPRINDMLEAFRPEVDDLQAEAWQPLRAALASDPEAQRRAEVIQRHDRAVRAAMHEAPVPAGLAERLLASLPEGEAADVLSATPPPAASVGLPPRPATAPDLGRRAWFAAAAVMSAAALVALVIGIWPNGPTDLIGEVGQEELARMVAGWENDAGFAPSGAWQEVSSPQGLWSHQIDLSDLQENVSPRHAIGPMLRDKRNVVVYELVTASGQTARLYVVHTRSTFAVPATPTPSLLRGLTGGRRGIAWQRGQYLYVAVIDAPDASPEQFLHIRQVT
jgi:hypothetical protein